MSTTEEATGTDFIREIIEEDLRTGKNGGVVATRFPPEPNGYLHIGHAKSICLNFGIAEQYGGTCNLRFDDTNPCAEEDEYVRSIEEDVRWLGFDWEDRLYFASDYFEQLYLWAEHLVQEGKAYVCDLSAEELREYRGNYYTPGKPSPYRDRTPEENLDLLRRMRAGDFPDGSKTLRAKIDVVHPNMNMRDPAMYRIRREHHHRTGDDWLIYPMYDFAHGESDAIEGITYSLCTLEFEDHRPLYDWFIQNLPVPSTPRQIEFGRLNLSYTVLSKRRLLQLVQDGHVDGWDDPRMPSLQGLRRRGFTPESIRTFCGRVGVAKTDGVVDVAVLEHTVREDLNERVPRVMGVLRPLRLVIENFPEDTVEWFDAPLHPEDDRFGTRRVPLTRVVYVERDDFREDPPRKWHRLTLGREVRLRYAALVTCTEVVKDDSGEVVELRCQWDPASKGGNSPDGRRVRGTVHWVSAEHALPATVRLYDRLFTASNPMDTKEGGDWLDSLNPDSLEVLQDCRVEPYLKDAKPEERFQFERLGYFCVDRLDSKEGALVFNRTVTLRDSWARIERQQTRQQARQQKAPSPKKRAQK